MTSPVDGEFFFMVTVAGLIATHCTLMMGLWAPMLGLPRADFPIAMADLSYGHSFAGKAPYWSGVVVIYLNGVVFAFLYATVVAPWLNSGALADIAPVTPLMNGAVYGVMLFVASGVFFQPVFLRLGLFLWKADKRGWITSLMVHGIFGLVCGWLAPVTEKIGG
jgi:hypothetical protein